MTQHIKNIIVGFDFSDTSRDALKAALGLAEKNNAGVHLVSALPGHLAPKVVWEATESAKPRRDQLYSGEDLMESLERRLWDTVKTFGDLAKHVTTVEVMKIKPDKAILALADLYNADLIVVGATGLNTLQRILLGSTSLRLVHTSRWPVLVVKPGHTWPPKEVLCTVDFSDASRGALEWGADIASSFDASLTAMNVVETTPAQMLDTFGVRYVDDFDSRKDALKASAFKEIETFCGEIEALDKLPWTSCVEVGLIDERIVNSASTKADLLCMGSVGRSGFQGMLLGNTAERVLRQLPCSMLIIKPDDFALKH